MNCQRNARKRLPVKIIGILLLLLALCLTGCGSKDDKNTDPKGQAAETTADTSVSAESDLDTEAAASPAETDKTGAAGAAGTTDTAGTANTDASEASGAGSGSDSDGKTAEAETTQAETAKKEPPEGWELTLPKEDWGLFFEHPGSFEQPSGNASPEDLAWYDAYYMGNAEDKVLYLTFDCGYENGTDSGRAEKA